MRAYSKLWTGVVAACMASLVLAALILPRSFALTALSDWIQCILLLSGALALIPNALRSRGRLRVFWALLATGVAFWFSYQAMWTYFEVWLRTDVPDLCAGDIILFLHIVPMMAALAVRPHAPQDEYSPRLRRLDFALMMVWWMYLYVFAVMAWQYVVANVTAYGNNLNLLYLIEKLAFLSALFVAWVNSKGGWKTFYANLFGASLTYAASSYFANWALGRHVYYSGSLYDIPLAVSMTWITVIGLWPHEDQPQNGARSSSASHGVWLARVGMITVFSLPLFAAWALLEPAIPPRIRWFRLVLTLAAALFMGILVFVRQRLLDRELLRLLNQSRESFANLKRLQAQITESEKLASIGQLVGGAAHELNNPIAAMLGYSDLLQSTPLNPEQQELAARIGQHVRRTKSLVASLLSFAKQGPAAMAPVDLHTVLRTAVKLSQPVWQALKIEVHTDLQADMPAVLGDSNQLLQVFVQIIHNASHSADQRGTRTLTLAAEHKEGVAVIKIFDGSLAGGPLTTPFTNPFAGQDQSLENHAPDAGSPQPLSGMGLSGCQGILQQHQGKISWQNNQNAGSTICVELPVIPAAPEKSPAAGVPAMWQPQPFA
ncbi:MAG: histidine kinase dimerization/phospho-acceptor domain-containing protein [Candidatus Sulfotelmatobacter sp.]